MALLRLLIQQIENQLFSSGFEHDLVLHFHVRPEFVGTMYEGIIVFSQDGRFLAANRNALQHLEMDRYQAELHTFSMLFNAPLAAIFDKPGQFPRPVQELHAFTGITIYCRGKTRLLNSSKGPLIAGKQSLSSPARNHGAERKTLLEDLELGDPGMRKIIAKIRKILEHDIPVLLEGESGTGKELFARAMHNSSSRRNGPFVALNCAALPEGLIESELFGYQEGAFTGAKRKGYIGKIRQADGGTLFLDEIGDMPLQFQARLLRVLQERTVSPLGGAESYQVDFALICATDRKMREEVNSGRFREALYYRLNGMLVTLPCLRQRMDRLELARSIINSLVVFGEICQFEFRGGRDIREPPLAGQYPPDVQCSAHSGGVARLRQRDHREHLPEDFLDQSFQGGHSPATTEHGKATALLVADGTSLESLEKIAIREAVRECGGNMAAAARRLGISRNTLYRKMQAFG